jgi:dipeptide transport system substrate-binding protein
MKISNSSSSIIYRLALIPLTLIGLITPTPKALAILPDKTLVYCSEGSPRGFDATASITFVDFAANAATLYNRLVDLGYDGKIAPSLAESYDISKDGRTYTFHLRRGVKFHTTPWFKPTHELTAADVVFTFERMQNPEMPFRHAYPTEFVHWHNTGLDKIISKIEAPDSYTVQFTLNKIHAPFLSKLAMPFASILSVEYATQLLQAGKPSEINQYPVGTGPFIFQKYIKDAVIYFDGNPNYWKPDDVQLSRLIFAITPDVKVQAEKLQANECQVISAVSLVDLPKLEHHSNISILSHPGFSMSFLAYNITHKPLGDVRVRRALDMAIDKEAIIHIVYENRAQIAVAPMAPSQWSYDKDLKDAPRDLEQAKKLLAQAGYPNGFTLSLWVSSLPAPNPRLMAEIIQADWARIGVKVTIVPYEWGEYLKRAMNGEHDTALFQWTSSINDPDYWFSTLRGKEVPGSFNVSKWHDELFNSVLNQAVQTPNIAQRTQLYLQAQRIFKREQPFTPIAYPIVYQPVNKNVTGFRINPFGTTQFTGVGLK